jgi:hypothetical protein
MILATSAPASSFKHRHNYYFKRLMEVFTLQQLKVPWREAILFLIMVSLFLGSGTAAAKNPDLSSWTLNLSESAAPSELGKYDVPQEIEVVGTAAVRITPSNGNFLHAGKWTII